MQPQKHLDVRKKLDWDQNENSIQKWIVAYIDHIDNRELFLYLLTCIFLKLTRLHMARESEVF